MTELTFKGKDFVYNHHLAVPFRPLGVQKQKGIGKPDLDGNLIVHGDNLQALKALLPMYAGKVDCIYIDPPYNTGNEGWCYSDNVNAPMIKEWFNSNPVGIEDGLRHDKWCAMMWPRLRLLQELISPDGLLFISIDDIENSRLIQIIKEIFGPERLLGNFVWKSRQNKDNRNVTGLSNDHEFILIVGNRIRGDMRLGNSYSNPDKDERGPWSSGNMVGLASKESRKNLHYDLIHPKTGMNYGCPNRGWRYESKRMDTLIQDDRVIWPSNPNGRPREKVFLNELKDYTNTSSVIDLPIYTNDGTDAIDSVMGSRVFEFPKPPSLIQFLINQHPNKDAIVMDSFSGSGTTAHAVLEANKKDGGNRRFILVEMEDYADKVTAERVRRVINGYDFTGTKKTELLREKITWSSFKKAEELTQQVEELEKLHGDEYDKISKTVKNGELIVTGETKIKEKVEGLGGSFTYCTLGEPLDLDRLLQGENLPNWKELGKILFNMATNTVIEVKNMRQKDFYLGEAGGQHLWLIYKDNLDWLKSPNAALTLDRAREIAMTDPSSKHLVFAPARFVSQKLLNEENIPVEFVPLPYSLYRIEGS